MPTWGNTSGVRRSPPYPLAKRHPRLISLGCFCSKKESFLCRSVCIMEKIETHHVPMTEAAMSKYLKRLVNSEPSITRVEAVPIKYSPRTGRYEWRVRVFSVIRAKRKLPRVGNKVMVQLTPNPDENNWHRSGPPRPYGYKYHIPWS